jgi:hypothetical protein
MIFGNRNVRANGSNLNIQIEGIQIERVKVVKFLGLMIDECLNWKSHISALSNKIAKNIGVINRIKLFLNKPTLKTLYFTLIHPHLLYCIMLWGNARKTTLESLVKLQKRGVRLITGSVYRAHTCPLFKSLCMLKINDLYTCEIASFMFKLVNNQLPSCCSDYIITATANRYALRQGNDFILEFAVSTCRQNSIAYTGPRVWKTIPVEAKNANSYLVFKRITVCYLISNY